MSDKLINKMIDNYNDENLKSLDKHIQEGSKKSNQPIYTIVVKHKGPTKVKTNKKSMKKLAKVILDL